MSNELDSEMIACAKTLRAATGNQTEVTVYRRVTFSNTTTGPSADFQIFFGDIMNRGEWKWETVAGATLQEVLNLALKKIMEQGGERARARTQLETAAAKLGLKLVEAK